MIGAAEQNVAAGDELGVFSDEDLAGRAEVEIGGLVAEVLAVDAGPDEAAVGIDVDLSDAEFGGGEVFVHVDAHGAGDVAAGGVDAGDLILWDGGGAVHDEREAGHAGLDLLEDIEMEGLFALEFEGAVAGADGAGEGIAAGLFDEVFGFGGVGEGGVAVLNFDVVLDAAEHAEFGFDGDPLGVGPVDDALGDLDVLVERVVGRVDHDGAEEAGVDALGAGLLITVVEVDGENGLGEDIARGADDGFQHALVGVGAGTLGNLDDERSLRLDGAAEKAHGLFRVIDVIGADGVLAVGVFKELRGGDDHGRMVCTKPVQHAAQQNKPQVKFRGLRFLLVRTAEIKKAVGIDGQQGKEKGKACSAAFFLLGGRWGGRAGVTVISVIAAHGLA